MEIERTERRGKGSVTLVGFSQKAPLAPWFVSDSSRGGGFARLVNRRGCCHRRVIAGWQSRVIPGEKLRPSMSLLFVLGLPRLRREGANVCKPWNIFSTRTEWRIQVRYDH